MPRKRKPELRKRYPLNMRTTRELRERIEAAAHASGRSLVQEVEYRLTQSFVAEDQTELYRRYAEQAAKDAAGQTVKNIMENSAVRNLLAKISPEGLREGGREERALTLSIASPTSSQPNRNRQNQRTIQNAGLPPNAHQVIGRSLSMCQIRQQASGAASGTHSGAPSAKLRSNARG